MPDVDRLQADACGTTSSYDSNTRLKLEAKDHGARGVTSPDEWAAVALTFAEAGRAGCAFSEGWRYPA